MKIEKPIKPVKSEGKTSKCLKVMLTGNALNRKTLGDLGIAANNDSAHSLISILRNERLIPIESNRISDETCDYYMKPEEITRFKDPILRQQQRMEMKKLVEEKRIIYACSQFLKLLDRLNKYPDVWRYAPTLPSTLKVISEAINAFIKKQGVN